jgi:hypothetical protein
VTIHYTCSDDLSGIASCPADVQVSADGANQTITRTATDDAGNSATATTVVNIDRTAPVVTATRPVANASGWTNGDVVVTFTCSDAVSGMAACSGPVTVSAEGANQVVTGTATDVAGNTATTTTSVSLDKTRPVITATVVGTKNSVGWYRGAVTIHYTCSDNLSGIATCPADVQVGADGANQTVTGTATDRAGNRADVSVTGLNIDRTAPAVTVIGGVNGSVYPLDKMPAVSCQTTDATSGVATKATPSVIRDTRGGYTATCSGGADIAGNTAPAKTITYTVTPTASTMSALLKAYLSANGVTASGLVTDTDAKLAKGQYCLYIQRITKETAAKAPAITAGQAAELIYWARVLNPSCAS